MDPHNYVTEFAAWFRVNARPEKAAAMAAYLKNQFPFLGIQTPERNASSP